MKTIADVLNSPPLPERLNNVKEALWQKEQLSGIIKFSFEVAFIPCQSGRV